MSKRKKKKLRYYGFLLFSIWFCWKGSLLTLLPYIHFLFCIESHLVSIHGCVLAVCLAASVWMIWYQWYFWEESEWMWQKVNDCVVLCNCIVSSLFYFLRKKKTKGKEVRERRSTVVVDAACLSHPPPFPSSLPPCVCLPRIFLFFSLSLSFFSFTLPCRFVSCVHALAQTVPKQKDTIEWIAQETTYKQECLCVCILMSIVSMKENLNSFTTGYNWMIGCVVLLSKVQVRLYMVHYRLGSSNSILTYTTDRHTNGQTTTSGRTSCYDSTVYSLSTSSKST